MVNSYKIVMANVAQQIYTHVLFYLTRQPISTIQYNIYMYNHCLSFCYYICEANNVVYVDLLIELMLNIPVNSYGHVGTLSPFYGTFIQNKDIMASTKCFKYNPTTKPTGLICKVGLT